MLVNYELEQDWSMIGGLRFDQEAKKWKLQFKLRVGNYQQEVQEIRGHMKINSRKKIGNLMF